MSEAEGSGREVLACQTVVAPAAVSGIPILQSRILSQFEEIRHGLSLRMGGVSPEPYGMNLSFSVGDRAANVRLNLERFLARLEVDPARIARTRQVHGKTIRFVRKPGPQERCDALLTTTPGLFLAISVADCVPIFLYDPGTCSVAAVHAGWRGSKLRLLSKVVAEMLRVLGARPENIHAYIGPSAGVCCYEIGEEVASYFESRYLRRIDGCGKPHLDLKMFNKDLLLGSGLPGAHIEVAHECTICQSALFHSYRREGGRSGRMLGVIGILER